MSDFALASGHLRSSRLCRKRLGLRLRHIRLCGRPFGFPLLNGNSQVAVIKRIEKLAGTNKFIVVYRDGFHPARDARTYLPNMRVQKCVGGAHPVSGVLPGAQAEYQAE